MLELTDGTATAAISTRQGAINTLRAWDRRRWLVAAAASLLIALLIGLPTDVIPNPVFGRPIPVTWWSYPTLLLSAVLGGLLVATYVGAVGGRDGTVSQPLDRPGRLGGLGGFVSFFAVGCPVCNKVVVLALGTTGARSWFEPVQPVLAVASLVLLTVALVVRLRRPASCAR